MMFDPTQISRMADYANGKSDRWLFIALLIVVIIGIVFIFRYIVSLLADAKADRVRYEANLQKITDSQQTIIRDLAVVMSKSNEVVAKNTEALDNCREQIQNHTISLAEWRHILDQMRRIADKPAILVAASALLMVGCASTRQDIKVPVQPNWPAHQSIPMIENGVTRYLKTQF
jgi:hypothetical protein